MRQVGVGDFQTTLKMKEYIDQVLDSGQLSYGHFSQRFEESFAKLHRCGYAILSNSGTSSLLVALQTLKELHGWQDGDEVIVPAITFVATVNIIIQNGLKPVIVDVEKDYYGIDCTLIDQAVTKKTRAIIPVHTFGQPCNMQFISSIANHYNLAVIEDSCECMFVTHYGVPVGSWGDISCFSTYMAHLITTGVGGIATTNDYEYAHAMRSLVNHGMNYDDLSKSDSFRPQQLGRDFIFDRIGHSFRVTELEAAIGLAQLEDWQQMINKRQDNAAYLHENLRYRVGDHQLHLPIIRPSTQHAFMMFPIICKQENTRDQLCQYLNEQGIGTRRMLPLVSQPCYKGLWNSGDYPVAQWIDDNGYYIGCHQYLARDDLDKIINVHWEFFSS
jgi:dTDP-4-amino-4,6-dideoxygalactose transaminase